MPPNWLFFKRVVATKAHDQARQTFSRCYLSYTVLSEVPTNDDSTRIDFMLESANKPVAKWRAGELKRYNKGLNVDL